MNPVAVRISTKLNELRKEQSDLQGRAKQLEKEHAELKHKIHLSEGNTLLHIAVAGEHKAPDTLFFNDVREVTNLKRSLKDSEDEHRRIKQKLSELTKQIDHYTFWLRRAETNDENLQREAERAIFG